MMENKEDHLLNELKDHYSKLSIPDQMDQMINNGIMKAKKKQRLKRSTYVTTIAVSILMLLFVTSIRVSPVFASFVTNIPGLSKVVELINYDKGLQSAVDNGFIQVIGKSDEHEEITFTVDSVIIDESKLIVFYTITGIEEYNYISLSKVELLKSNGERYKVGTSYDHNINEVEDMVSNKIDFSFHGDTPEEFTLNVNISTSENADTEENLPYTWSVPFQVDKTLFENMKHIYDINQTVNIEDQLITFEKVTIYPTRSELSISFDENNSKKIFGFDDLRIVDQSKNEWSTNNGVSAVHISDHERLLYFDSNYFYEPDEMYIEFKSIRTLDKDKLELQVDLEQQKLIKAPDENITLEFINEKGGELEIGFRIKYDGLHQIRSEEISHEFHDSSATYSFRTSTSSILSNDNAKETVLLIPKREYSNPLTFSFWDYPARIYEDVQIKIK
ncbi:DUF4179 domain-containing protein [Chengkuizengella sediminis]|uniref:DUF4179 domain-containing protein n=1 Tax=Chengkuizengella sediminis TaxID=1885917 RepID=UPI00138A441B|nr:DUF4179 domain-containing protein [Chengkuizengella sediminis]NDI36170.1 DUF4179 domain-containing protein [Chengkuizengella sediminis]